MSLCSGLSCVAACAPSDKFLYMGGALGMGLGVVVVSSIGKILHYMKLSHCLTMYSNTVTVKVSVDSMNIDDVTSC